MLTDNFYKLLKTCFYREGESQSHIALDEWKTFLSYAKDSEDIDELLKLKSFDQYYKDKTGENASLIKTSLQSITQKGSYSAHSFLNLFFYNPKFPYTSFPQVQNLYKIKNSYFNKVKRIEDLTCTFDENFNFDFLDWDRYSNILEESYSKMSGLLFGTGNSAEKRSSSDLDNIITNYEIIEKETYQVPIQFTKDNRLSCFVKTIKNNNDYPLVINEMGLYINLFSLIFSPEEERDRKEEFEKFHEFLKTITPFSVCPVVMIAREVFDKSVIIMPEEEYTFTFDLNAEGEMTNNFISLLKILAMKEYCDIPIISSESDYNRLLDQFKPAEYLLDNTSDIKIKDLFDFEIKSAQESYRGGNTTLFPFHSMGPNKNNTMITYIPIGNYNLFLTENDSRALPFVNQKRKVKPYKEISDFEKSIRGGDGLNLTNREYYVFGSYLRKFFERDYFSEIGLLLGKNNEDKIITNNNYTTIFVKGEMNQNSYDKNESDTSFYNFTKIIKNETDEDIEITEIGLFINLLGAFYNFADMRKTDLYYVYGSSWNYYNPNRSFINKSTFNNTNQKSQSNVGGYYFYLQQIETVEHFVFKIAKKIFDIPVILKPGETHIFEINI